MSINKHNYIFLLEVKMTWAKVDRVKNKLSFQSLFHIDNLNNGGGLALMWKDTVEVQLLSFSKIHIDSRVRFLHQDWWWLIGFCGNSNQARREKSWQLLCQLHVASTMPWVCLWELNELLHSFNKKDSNAHTSMAISIFQSVVSNYSLHELGIEGPRFTWERGRSTPRWLQEQLDMVIVSSS